MRLLSLVIGCLALAACSRPSPAPLVPTPQAAIRGGSVDEPVLCQGKLWLRSGGTGYWELAPSTGVLRSWDAMHSLVCTRSGRLFGLSERPRTAGASESGRAQEAVLDEIFESGWRSRSVLPEGFDWKGASLIAEGESLLAVVGARVLSLAPDGRVQEIRLQSPVNALYPPMAAVSGALYFHGTYASEGETWDDEGCLFRASLYSGSVRSVICRHVGALVPDPAHEVCVVASLPRRSASHEVVGLNGALVRVCGERVETLFDEGAEENLTPPPGMIGWEMRFEARLSQRVLAVVRPEVFIVGLTGGLLRVANGRAERLPTPRFRDVAGVPLSTDVEGALAVGLSLYPPFTHIPFLVLPSDGKVLD